jgi:hypothetical protein
MKADLFTKNLGNKDFESIREADYLIPHFFKLFLSKAISTG